MRLVEKVIGAGALGPRVHRVVAVTADHQDRDLRGRGVGAYHRDQLDPRDARQHEVADQDVVALIALQMNERALRIRTHGHLERRIAKDRLDERAARPIFRLLPSSRDGRREALTVCRPPHENLV